MNSCKISLPRGLKEALFIARRNRFAAEVEICGRREAAHVPSSGRMGELLYPGARVYVAPRDRPGAGLKYRILLAEGGCCPVSVDSLLPNRLVRRALASGGGCLWVDFEGVSRDEGEPLLRDVFGFHHLPIDDCFNELVDPPKAEVYDGYLFVIVQGIDYASASRRLAVT
ncbi:MAG: hypothetical protein K6T66_13815, partial [Peptococcaceae bacterium]|nr:hypothetical protein [Peptococcaceae bacterium]